MTKVFICLVLLLCCTLIAQNAEIDLLIAQLSDPNAEIREKASEKLAELGESAHPATQALIQALSDESVDVIYNSVEALGKIGQPAQVAIPILIQLFHSKKSKSVDCQVIKALAKIGGDPKVIAPILIEALVRPDDFFTSQAAKEALMAVKEEALPLLIEKLAQPDTNTRTASIEVLEKMETFAEPAIPSLVKLLYDEKDYIYLTSARALSKIGTESTDDLLQLFDTGDILTRMAVQTIFCEMDENIAVPFLIKNIFHGNQNIRLNVLDILEQIDSEKKLLAIPHLLEIITHSDEATRHRAIVVLKSYPSDVLQKLNEKDISRIINLYLLSDPEYRTAEYIEEILLMTDKVTSTPILLQAYSAPTTSHGHKKAMEKLFSALQIKLVSTEDSEDNRLEDEKE